MGVIAERVVISDAVPQSLIAALAQSDSFNNGDRPAKRRKVTKSGPYSLSQQRGVSASGTPLGYIPLARLALRMSFSDDPELNDVIPSDSTATPCSLPVLVEIRSVGASHDDSNKSTAQDKPYHRSWSLELRAIDTERTDFLKQQFNDLQQSSFFQQLEHATRLTSADRHFSRGPPRACYQASIRPLPEYKCLQLDVVILWEDSLELPDFVHLQDPVLEVFAKYALQETYECPKSLSGQREHRENLLGYPRGWSPRQFYESVHVPSDTKSSSAEIHCPGLACQLFPFQRRAVRWLLRREGVELQNDGTITSTERPPRDGLPASFKGMKDADGNTCYFSQLFMTITTNIHHWSDAADHLRGGILAEEMGLGKTVEMIALINLNRRLVDDDVKFDPDEQWKQEIEQHAPGLRVHHYTGIKRGQEKSDDLIIEEVADFDVVLTTYNVISREIHYAGAAPKRSLRHEKRFEPRKTPLVRILWWRVCLDEAQMIESGVSNAAKVARLIPRENAWAVTGTPLRKNIDDLFGLLLFLHYRPFCDSSTVWKRLFSRFGPVLANIINAIALRHSKDRVRDELRLPPQKRVVITTPFTAIEEQHYGQLFEEMCEQCGLEASGAPLRDDWNPEDPGTVEKMRTWLTRLRQTCLHPEVSGSNRRALGAANGPLRTVDEVLEVMVENTDTSIRTEERTLLLSQLRRGQLLENAKRRKESLAIWQTALKYSTELVEDSRKQLRLQRLQSKDDSPSNGAGSTDMVDLSDKDNEEVDKNSRIGQCRLRLRAALEVQHIAVFFTANAYYQIKSDPNLTRPDSEEFKELEKKEEEGYEAAKLIRKEMLTDISRKVERYMKIIEEKTQQKQFVQIPRLEPHLYNRGLVSYRLINKFEDLCDALNKHAAQYNEWRDVMIRLVSQSLIDQEEDAELEGNEYERSTKHQDEMYVYMEALRSMYADRHDALTGQKNILISHEVKLGIIQAQKGEGPSPELFLRIMNTRSELMPDPELGSLRGIVSELRSLVTSLEWQAGEGNSRVNSELEIVGMVLKNAGQMISEQLKVSSSLEREVEMFRDTMNNRLEYYRHLQQISDTVAPYDEENAGKPMDEDFFASKLAQEEALEKKIASLKSKRRYLIHLRDESGSEDTSRICIICQSSFEVGVLTNAIYSDISSGLLKEIKMIDLNGSFGTKIDTLARHVLWLREHDPGAKSIVFSQYKNFLTVLQRAFQRFGIISSSVDAPGGIEKFKKDPAVECFLLHGKAQSSGLTLINATHVFLCEPLINTAIELQAIARVHRIGQHRPTTVWMYLVSGTVEESIYELSVARRLNHIIEKEKQEKNTRLKIAVDGDDTLIDDLTETAIDSANSMEMQDASLNNLMTSGSSGGEMVKKDDLWQCLFGNSTQKDSHGHSTEAEREVGRFLRGEAAEQRRDDMTN
ncbi:uncharacterized protein N7477_005621 [Penicillium maclennaniae]|uniref:uncharacterized protein n=1 Tax=Penicillium maclennaniae TaxID=1343394 RepID=UPI00254168A3|nr:uncharacterized protein N7477_005621 [Penicillium maclennaniae]KAJ5670258.1 hypothetical protein N7477_005621 [Penicillium maclennaniae]